MSIRSGIAAQAGFVAESTYGTAVAATTFVPLVSESIKRKESFTESSGIIAGRQVMTSDQWNSGSVEIGGDLQLELYDTSTRALFQNMFGTESGAGPYTYTPSDLFGTSLTVQIGRPGVDGTVRPFTYAGCRISSWEIGCSVGETAKLGLSILAQSESVATSGANALQTASYTAALKPFKFTGATVTVAGSAVPVKQLTIAGDNAQEERRFLGSTQSSQPIATDLRKYSGSLQAEFTDLTHYNLFVAHTEVAIVATFSANSKSIVITMNARLDGETPNVGGKGIVEQPLPFTCIASGADSTAITAVVTY